MKIRSILKFLRGGDSLTAAASSQPPVDLATLASIMGDDKEELLFSFLDRFVEMFPDLLDDLKIAVQDCDARLLTDRVHTAKGAALGIGAHTLSEILQEMETCNKSEFWDGSAANFKAVQSEYDRIVQFCKNRS